MGSGFFVRRLAGACVCSVLLLAARGWCDEELPPRFDVEFFDPAEIEAAAVSGAPCELYFLGSSHLVLLEPVDLRSYRFHVSTRTIDGERTVYKSPPRTFKGAVVGDPRSTVRISTSTSGVRGYVRTAGNWIFIRPLPVRAALAEGEHMVFTDADLSSSVVGSCAVRRSVPRDFFTPERASAPATVAAAGETRIFELAVDADFEYFSRYGSGTVAEIESVLNEVAGMLEPKLGLQLEIVHINVWEDAADPYTSTDPNTVLDELRGYWNANMGSINRDCVHLFTGKDLDDFTVGLAFLDAVCRLSVAYGFTQDLNPNSLVPIVVAHELGHNLGADHDDPDTSPRYIMYASISGSNLAEYSDESESQISAYLSGVGCLETLPGGNGDPAPTAPSGGGGGPVDPLLLLVLASALTYMRARDANARL